MNIAYVNADSGIPLFSSKGAAVHVRDFSLAAHRMGHDVRVFTASAGQVPAGWPLAVDVFGEGVTPGGTRAASDDVSPEQRALARNRAVHAALRARQRARAFDLLYERYSLWSYAGSVFARRHRVPFVLEVNSPLVVEQSTYRQLDRRETARRIERYLFAAASRVVAVSEQVADYVCRNGGDPSRTRVVQNGVDLSLYREPAPPRSSHERFTIAFLGSLKPWHGLEVLLDALALLVRTDERFHVRVIGDGPERASLAEGVQRRGLASHVDVVGHVPREAVPAQLREADACVAPYPRLDGFYFSPLKVYEYMASGRPIVASRIGQIESVLHDGVTALLVEPGDAGALAGALHRLRAQPALAARLANAARTQALACHGWEHAVSKVLGDLPGAVPACSAEVLA